MRRRWLAWAPAAAWAAVLFYLSSRPSLGVDLSGGLDKVAHFGAYLVLGVLLARAASVVRLSIFVAILIGALYGAIDEFHQSFVPGRTAEFADWLADAAGTIAGVVLYRLWWRRRAGWDADMLLGSAENASK